MQRNYSSKPILEAGCDEAGRGCLAGPVVAAAVILPPDFNISILNDSKKLSESQRFKIRDVIEKKAYSWAVSSTCNEIIDQINILNASILSMHKALDEICLDVEPDLILVDGNRFKPFSQIQHICLVKGDAHYASIAAASILAKTYRDDIMDIYHEKYPDYGWSQNKGYPTQLHREAIQKFGPTPLHRKSFTLLPQQLKLF